MTVAQLSRLLYELNVPPDLYRLDGSHLELAEVLTREDTGWAVFLSERGEQTDRVEFRSEHDACIHLLGRVAAELIERRRLAVVPRPD
jgi:hypothetical protein